MTRKRLLLTLFLILTTLLALGLRLRAADQLSIDYDEDDYLSAGQHYAEAIRRGDLPELMNYHFNYEHPPLTKILYGLGFLAFQPVETLPELSPDNPPASSLPQPQFSIARNISVLFGALQVLVVFLLDPLGGLLLAVHTWQIKYTSQIMLEPLPALTSCLAVFFYLRSRRRWGLNLALAGLMLGLTAASKYTYCVVGLVIVIDWLWQLRKEERLPDLPAVLRELRPILVFGLLAFLFFYAADPHLWPDPFNRLKESVFYHGGYATSDYVRKAGLPLWQPLVWLAESVPWQSEVFLISLDGLITLLALAGLRRQWQKQPIFVLWLGLALGFLLLWPTKWPQYILILTVPLSITASQGVWSIVDWLRQALPSFKFPRLRMTTLEKRELRKALPWLAPGLLILTVITAFPLVYQLAISQTDFTSRSILDGLQGGVWRELWLGITGQVQSVTVDIFGQPRFSKEVHYAGMQIISQLISGPGISLFAFEGIWTLLSLLSQAALGIAVAVVLNNPQIPFRNLWRAVLILPWAIPEFVGALIWSQVLNPSYGWVPILGKQLNLPEALISNWNTSPDLTLVMLLFANLWYGFPIMFLAASAGLKGLSPEVLEAAAIDGANRIKLFWQVTLPLLFPLLTPVLILRTIQIFNQFYLFYVTDPPFPALTLSLISYGSFRQGMYAISAGVNVITVLVLLVLIIIINNRAKRVEGAVHDF
jgi:ABC-type sugar transport system permease subunit